MKSSPPVVPVTGRGSPKTATDAAAASAVAKGVAASDSVAAPSADVAVTVASVLDLEYCAAEAFAGHDWQRHVVISRRLIEGIVLLLEEGALLKADMFKPLSIILRPQSKPSGDVMGHDEPLRDRSPPVTTPRKTSGPDEAIPTNGRIVREQLMRLLTTTLLDAAMSLTRLPSARLEALAIFQCLARLKPPSLYVDDAVECKWFGLCRVMGDAAGRRVTPRPSEAAVRIFWTQRIAEKAESFLAPQKA